MISICCSILLAHSGGAGNIGKHDRSSVSPPNYFKGVIDEFKLWNKALSLEEIEEELCAEILSNKQIKTERDHIGFAIVDNKLFVRSNNIVNIHTIRIFDMLSQELNSSK